MNDELYKRYRKMKSDPSFILFSARDPKGNIHYLVQGSNRYKVTIFATGKIECSCPDMSFRVRKTDEHYKGSQANNYICKHCLLIVSELGFNDINHSFFKRTFFSPDEIQTIQKNYKKIKK